MYDEGIYTVRTLRWYFMETVNGFDQFEMIFAILGMVDRGNPEGPARSCETGVRSWSIALKGESNVAWLTGVVLGLGYNGDDLLGLDPDREGAFDFTDVKFFAECKHHSYNERTTEQWSVFQPRQKSLPKGRVQDLNERHGQAFRDEKARRTPKTPPNPDVPTDDPF
jgi:hypothetical protein